MRINRRTLLGGLVTAPLHASPLAAQQSDWPTRPVRFVSPYAAGGANDISARILAEFIGNKIGQQIIIENKAGAGTRIASESVAKAQADGYTFLYAAAPYATAEALYGALRYERKDLAPVALAMLAPLFLIVNANAPYKTLEEFLAFARGKPDGVTFGSPGAGSQPHLAAELLFKDAGIKGINVVFRGDAPAYNELLAGRIDATLTAITSALSFIEAGSLRVLGVAAESPSSLYPAAPPLRAGGLARVVASGWYGFLAPTATPQAIVKRMEQEVDRALADAQVMAKLAKLGLEPRAAGAAAFGRFIDDETQKWSNIIREAGLKGEP